MKLNNPILITLNNTLHIKADNLEPMEVDSSCTSELETIISKYYRSRQGFRDSTMARDLFEGLPISELLDRIEVRKIYAHKRESLNNFVYRAFLLPVKEDITDSLKERKDIEDAYRKQFGIEKSYTIEEIEKAIRKENDNCGQPLTDKSIDEIINNLKK